MKRFSKEGGVGFMPIFANKCFTNVNIKSTVNSMKNLHGFCTCNNLSAGRIAKLQGGYYTLSDSNTWDKIGLNLNDISFEEVYNRLSSYEKIN